MWLSNRRVKFESVITLFSMINGTWFLDEQDTRQNTELKKSVVQSVLLCLSCRFMYILRSKFIKVWKKIIKQKKKNNNINKSFNFAESNAHRKQTRATALRHTIYFFSLTKVMSIRWILWFFQSNIMKLRSIGSTLASFSPMNHSVIHRSSPILFLFITYACVFLH